MSADEVLHMDLNNETNLVRPKVEFFTLLKHAGATKDVFTMKEVMFYLGQYIMQKQLYDQKQQHIVHCAQDALGRVLGLDSFSVKEPRILFAMVTKNLVAVKNQDPTINSSEGRGPQVDRGTEGTDRGTQAAETQSSPPDSRRRQRSSSRSNDPGPSHSAERDDEDDEEEERKRRRSDSYSLTFDDSLSWCVIGGLGSGRDRTSSQSDVHSLSERSEVAAPSDVDSDNFSVEFEVESIDSDDYSEDNSSLSADDQVYEVTVYEDDEDDDAELTDADFWLCEKCKELNPPLPRNCQRCWTPRQDWLRDAKVNTSNAMPTKPSDQSAAKETPGSEVEDDGVDVPDGKRDKSLPASQDDLVSSQPPSSQEKLLSSDSQPSTSYSSLDSQPSTSYSLLDSQELQATPELERSVSAESRLPDSCLDPCLICESRPKNGCIVHGKTGHLMSCYVCARKLKRRNKMCPVCRMPIQQVVLTYFS